MKIDLFRESKNRSEAIESLKKYLDFDIGEY